MPRKKKDDEIVEIENTAEPEVEAAAVEHDGDASTDATAEFPAESDGEADTSPETDPEPAPEPIPEPQISGDAADEPPADDDETPLPEPAADATESESLDESESVFAYKLDLSAVPEDGAEESDAPIVPKLPEAEPEADAGEDADADDDAEADSEPLPMPQFPNESNPTAESERPSAPQPQPISRKPAAPRKKNILSLNLNELDRDLSDKQRDEWNAIYASFRAKSVMSGTVVGVDTNTFDVTNRETGIREKKTMHTLVVIGYRVKIIIPEAELWMPGEERPSYTIRGMAGAKIDFVIMEIDREGDCAIASRRLAITERRRHFLRGDRSNGEQLTCRVTIVGAKRCSVECNGFDLHLTQRDLSYSSIADLRDKYSTGQELKCVLKSFDARTGAIEVSVKDAMPNPFDGADMRHPIRSRRQAVISGKYAGGVFCTLPDETVCLCLYSSQHSDGNFRIGDGVILVVTKHDFSRQLMYGKILSKW